jgi:hypothetical protein
MKKLWVASAITAMFLGAQAYGDTVTSVNVVGYVNLTVYGGSNDTYTLIAAPMTKMPVAKGTISANTTTTITDGSAAWAVNTFAAGSTNLAVQPGASTYYIEVTSGTFEGRHFYIASNNGTTLTLAAAMADINDGDLAGQTYKIIPANRIRDIFGEPGSPALKGGSSPNNADVIYVMNSGWDSPIYYRNSGLGLPMNAWAQAGVDVSNLVVDRDEGMLVLRRSGGNDVALTVIGEVSSNTQAAVVVPGWSLIGGMSAVSVPIGQSSLTNVMAGGSSAGNADILYEWAGGGWSSPVYYRNSGLGTPINTWVQGGVDVAESFNIQAGKAYLIRRAGFINKQWLRESPLAQ